MASYAEDELTRDVVATALVAVVVPTSVTIRHSALARPRSQRRRVQ
jgi:hypothetical protein